MNPTIPSNEPPQRPEAVRHNGLRLDDSMWAASRDTLDSLRMSWKRPLHFILRPLPTSDERVAALKVDKRYRTGS